MLVVEIDMLDAEPLERRIARALDVLGATVHADPFAVTIAHVTEFRGEYYGIPFAFDRPADQLFVCLRTVDVGGIEERDAELEGPVDCRNRLGVVPGAVEIGHPHASKAEGGDWEALGAESPSLHG